MFKVLQQKRAHAVSAGTACLVSSAFSCWAAHHMLCLACFHSIGIKTSLFYDDLLNAERGLGEILALRSGEDWRGEKQST